MKDNLKKEVRVNILEDTPGLQTINDRSRDHKRKTQN